MPTRVFGGRWGRRIVGDGERGRGIAVGVDAVLFSYVQFQRAIAEGSRNDCSVQALQKSTVVKVSGIQI